ncbi:phage tail spike protein [Marinilactibacillus psychrotolerans]
MSNVILYESTATDFFNQGLGPLTEAKDPKVTEVGNGEFYIELDYPTTGRLFNQLKNGNLIKSDAGHELKDQRFEIKRVVKSMKQGYVSVYAEHISNQALDIALPANVTLSGSAQTALQQAQSNGLGTFKPFTMSSDITTTNSTTLSIKEFKNLKQALGGVEGSILDTWGGEYKFDNYHISLFKKRGRQANAMIAYGRNLVDLEQEENIMNTFTSVYPYAVWRDKDGAEHIIEGSVIHSDHADKYPHYKVLPVDFTLEVEDDTKPTATKLNQLATAYIENNDIGIPEVSIRLTHLDLSKTLDYKEYAEVEKLNVFDEVKIYFADFDINTTAKIVRIVWNVNLERYDEIEVGKVRASLSDRINTIGKQISEARKEAQDARNVSMVAANGVNMVFFGPDEPTATKVGDRWFMEDGQYTISKVWDGVIWRVVSDPRLSDQNAQLISEQKDQIDDMKLDVDYSRDQLQQTIANSGFTDLDTAFGNVKTLSEQSDGRLTLAEQFFDGFRNTAFDPSTGQLSLTEQTINGLQDTVSDPVNGLETRVTTIADGFQVLSNDVDGLEAQLSVTNENVLARVQKGDVYSQLLIDSRNILFDAYDRIMLSANKVVIDASEGAFITSAIIESLSADKITAGTIDASQVNVINLDASRISTGIIGGSAGNSWNMTTGLLQTVMEGTNTRAELNGGVIRSYSDKYGVAEINGGRIDFDDGTYRVGVNPTNIYFARGNNIRNLYWMSEGLKIQPGPFNSGTDLNTSLHFIGGGTGSHQYIQFSDNATNGILQRITALDRTLWIQHANNRGRVEISNYNRDEFSGDLYLGSMIIKDASGNGLRLVNNRIENVNRSGNRDVMISPAGMGNLLVKDPQGRWYGIHAYALYNQSSRKIKTNIVDYDGSGLGAVNGLNVVEYNMKQDLARGINERKVGFIAEDSPCIASKDMESIDSYKLTTLTVKAVQELSAKYDDLTFKLFDYDYKIENLKSEVQALKEELKQLKGAA